MFEDSVRLSSEFHFRERVVVGSCYGLVCLAMFGTYRPKKIVLTKPTCACCAIYRLTKKFDRLILWNPLTQECYPLPNQTMSKLSESRYGFGYDSINESFKVVVASGTLTELYDHSTNTWDSFETINWGAYEDALGRPLAKVGQFLKGALHWIVSDSKMIALDLATKAYTDIGLPLCCDDSDQHNTHHTLELGVLQDCLSISCNKKGSMEVGIWVMKRYGDVESWIKAYTIVNEDSSLSKVSLMRPLWVFGDGEVLFNVDKRIVIWHPELEEFRCDKKRRFDSPTHGMIHVSTLLSPKPKISQS